jgi:hypothetical protein
MNVTRLSARRGIGHPCAVLQNVTVLRAGAAIRLGREPAVVASRHRLQRPVRDGDRHCSLRRRPNPETSPAGFDQVCTER